MTVVPPTDLLTRGVVVTTGGGENTTRVHVPDPWTPVPPGRVTVVTWMNVVDPRTPCWVVWTGVSMGTTNRPPDSSPDGVGGDRGPFLRDRPPDP